MRRLVATMIPIAACACSVTNDVPSNRAAAPEDSGAPFDAGALPGFDVSASFDVCSLPSTFLVGPRDWTLLVDWTSSTWTPTVRYTAWQTDCDRASDVTDAVSFSVDDRTLGHFEGPLFVALHNPARLGAKTTVRATRGEETASTSLLIVQMQTGGAHPDVLFSFGGCGGTPAQIVATAVPAGTPLDVSTAIRNDPTSDRPLTSEIARVRAMSEGSSANGCAPSDARDADGDGVDDTFVAASGKSVCFEITPAIPSGADFVAFGWLDVVGAPGAIALDARRIVDLFRRTMAPC